jgi:hypothetical protein
VRWFDALRGAAEETRGALDFDAWRQALPPPLSPMLMRGKPLHREARRTAGQPETFLDALDAWQPDAPGF